MPENWSVPELVNAGWREADLAWESTSERMAEAVVEKADLRAKEEAAQALQIARAEFEPIDPRLGTSLANYGVCLSLAGDSQGIASLFLKGLEAWRRSDPWIARMDAPRAARSSLFHMRMEARHRDTYRARWQQRWRELADDAIKRLESLDGPGAVRPPSEDILARWLRERPAMLNDTRKLMAAAYLLLVPPSPSA